MIIDEAIIFDKLKGTPPEGTAKNFPTWTTLEPEKRDRMAPILNRLVMLQSMRERQGVETNADVLQGVRALETYILLTCLEMLGRAAGTVEVSAAGQEQSIPDPVPEPEAITEPEPEGHLDAAPMGSDHSENGHPEHPFDESYSDGGLAETADPEGGAAADISAEGSELALGIMDDPEAEERHEPEAAPGTVLESRPEPPLR